MILKYAICMIAIISAIQGLPLSNDEENIIESGLNKTKIVTLYEAIMSSLEDLKNYLGIDYKPNNVQLYQHDEETSSLSDEQEDAKHEVFKSESAFVIRPKNDNLKPTGTTPSGKTNDTEPLSMMGVRLLIEPEETENNNNLDVQVSDEENPNKVSGIKIKISNDEISTDKIEATTKVSTTSIENINNTVVKDVIQNIKLNSVPEPKEKIEIGSIENKNLNENFEKVKIDDNYHKENNYIEKEAITKEEPLQLNISTTKINLNNDGKNSNQNNEENFNMGIRMDNNKSETNPHTNLQYSNLSEIAEHSEGVNKEVGDTFSMEDNNEEMNSSENIYDLTTKEIVKINSSELNEDNNNKKSSQEKDTSLVNIFIRKVAEILQTGKISSDLGRNISTENGDNYNNSSFDNLIKKYLHLFGQKNSSIDDRSENSNEIELKENQDSIDSDPEENSSPVDIFMDKTAKIFETDLLSTQEVSDIKSKEVQNENNDSSEKSTGDIFMDNMESLFGIEETTQENNNNVRIITPEQNKNNNDSSSGENSSSIDSFKDGLKNLFDIGDASQEVNSTSSNNTQNYDNSSSGEENSLLEKFETGIADLFGRGEISQENTETNITKVNEQNKSDNSSYEDVSFFDIFTDGIANLFNSEEKSEENFEMNENNKSEINQDEKDSTSGENIFSIDIFKDGVEHLFDRGDTSEEDTNTTPKTTQNDDNSSSGEDSSPIEKLEKGIESLFVRDETPKEDTSSDSNTTTKNDQNKSDSSSEEFKSIFDSLTDGISILFKTEEKSQESSEMFRNNTSENIEADSNSKSAENNSSADYNFMDKISNLFLSVETSQEDSTTNNNTTSNEDQSNKDNISGEDNLLADVSTEGKDSDSHEDFKSKEGQNDNSSSQVQENSTKSSLLNLAPKIFKTGEKYSQESSERNSNVKATQNENDIKSTSGKETMGGTSEIIDSEKTSSQDKNQSEESFLKNSFESEEYVQAPALRIFKINESTKNEQENTSDNINTNIRIVHNIYNSEKNMKSESNDDNKNLSTEEPYKTRQIFNPEVINSVNNKVNETYKENQEKENNQPNNVQELFDSNDNVNSNNKEIHPENKNENILKSRIFFKPKLLSSPLENINNDQEVNKEKEDFEYSTEESINSSVKPSTLIVYEILPSGEKVKASIPNNTEISDSTTDSKITNIMLSPRLFNDASEQSSENNTTDNLISDKNNADKEKQKYNIDENLNAELSEVFQDIIKNLSTNATHFNSLTVKDVSSIVKRMMIDHFSNNSSNDGNTRISSSLQERGEKNLDGVVYHVSEDLDMDSFVDAWLETVLNSTQFKDVEVKFVNAMALPSTFNQKNSPIENGTKGDSDYEELTSLFRDIINRRLGSNDSEIEEEEQYLGPRISSNSSDYNMLLRDELSEDSLSTRWSFKDMFCDIFGMGCTESPPMAKKANDVPRIETTTECQNNENDTEQHEMFAVIPSKNASPSMVTLIWNQEKCRTRPKELQVDVFGTSFGASTNVYVKSSKHVCGALTELPEDAWLLANVNLRGKSGSTTIPWPDMTVSDLKSSSYVIVENVRSGSFLCGTLQIADIEDETEEETEEQETEKEDEEEEGEQEDSSTLQSI